MNRLHDQTPSTMSIDLQARGLSIDPSLTALARREAAAFEADYGHLLRSARIRLFEVDSALHGGLTHCCLIAMRGPSGAVVMRSGLGADAHQALRAAFVRLRRDVRQHCRAARRRHPFPPITLPA